MGTEGDGAKANETEQKLMIALQQTRLWYYLRYALVATQFALIISYFVVRPTLHWIRN